eukprot:TRINITY_DN3248_c0_g1_i7.p1 TRINITY_DN3248_c0_g1~~TRINITY_DN3248_c0_g1_i7.p1  ORF type:complete len:256 (-),score=17.48 TRINITY_DN3248_c0_g1_i7:46-813(-)
MYISGQPVLQALEREKLALIESRAIPKGLEMLLRAVNETGHTKSYGDRKINLEFRSILSSAILHSHRLLTLPDIFQTSYKPSMLPPPTTVPYQAQFPQLMSSRQIPGFKSAGQSPLHTEKQVPTENKASEITVGLSPQSSFKATSKSCSRLKSKTYRRRNVYKSIIRHMHRFFRDNINDITHMLTENGFNKGEIEKAFQNVKEMSDREKLAGMPKKPKGTLNTILSSKNIYVYVLKESIETVSYTHLTLPTIYSV